MEFSWKIIFSTLFEQKTAINLLSVMKHWLSWRNPLVWLIMGRWSSQTSKKWTTIEQDSVSQKLKKMNPSSLPKSSESWLFKTKDRFSWRDPIWWIIGWSKSRGSMEETTMTESRRKYAFPRGNDFPCLKSCSLSRKVTPNSANETEKSKFSVIQLVEPRKTHKMTQKLTVLLKI